MGPLTITSCAKYRCFESLKPIQGLGWHKGIRPECDKMGRGDLQLHRSIHIFKTASFVLKQKVASAFGTWKIVSRQAVHLGASLHPLLRVLSTSNCRTQ